MAVLWKDPRVTEERGSVGLPDDPTGIEEPHDTLAAEEFPLPSPDAHPSSAGAGGQGAGPARPGLLVGAGLLGGLALGALLRRRGR